MTPPDRSARPRASSADAEPRAAKLTIGQRVLTKLPKIQPSSSGAGSTDAAGPGAPAGKAPAGKAPAGKRPANGSPAGGAKRPAGAGTPGKPASRPATQGGAGAPRVPAGDATPAAAKPFGARLRDSLIKPAPSTPSGGAKRAPTKADPFPDIPSEQLRKNIRTLDDRERLYTLIAAPLGAAVGITGMVVTLQRNPAIGVKGHQTPSAIVLVGAIAVGLAVLALVGGILRKRSFAAFALMFLGFGASLAGGSFAALPFLGLGLWFIFRSNKMQKALVARGEHPRQQRSRAGGARGTAGGRPTAGARSGTRPAGSRQGRRAKAGVPAGPPASKRFTPPKPKDDDER